MKQLVALFLSVIMLVGIMPAVMAENHEIEQSEVSIYVEADQPIDDPLTLYFLDGVNDLPYANVEEWVDLFSSVNSEIADTGKYELTIDKNGPVITLTRETGYTAELDFQNDTVSFVDYNGFMNGNEDHALLDVLSASGFNENGEASLFQRNKQASFDRYGDSIVFNLADWNIDMIQQEDLYLVPLQTLNDLFLFPTISAGLLYNGSAIIMGNSSTMMDEETGGLSQLGELYYSVETGTPSEELAEYNYNELCMALDNFYGLKESHDISSFAQTFWEIGFDEVLRSTDTRDSDLALHQFINLYLDDQHSGYLLPSYFTGVSDMEEVQDGLSTGTMNAHMMRYGFARTAFYPDGVPAYEEVGNTAYVTFDEFSIADNVEDYYAIADGAEPSADTVGLIIYAHSMITRPDSPIENVVLDLSNNTGGAADAAIFVISWMLGDGAISQQNTLTHAMSNAVYRVDVNLDREFDEKDTVADKNLYCLISPVSFSCGNLVPAALKSSQKVTLIGTTSGGGSCVVYPMSTATGTLIQISGPSRLAFLKNGSFYNIDRGVDPDYSLNHLENYYDREALTNYINGLF